MKKLLVSSALLLLPLLSFSVYGEHDGEQPMGGLEVTWIDGNTIRVTGGTLGSGAGDPTYTVITNFFGTCTNCVNISPAELRAIKDEVISLCEHGDSVSSEISNLADEIYEICNEAIREIGHYVRYDIKYNTSIFYFTNYYNEIIRQDYDYSYVHGKQGELTKDYYSQIGTTSVNSSNMRLAIAFSNGIYDYANNVDASNYSQIEAKADQLSSVSSGISSKLDTIREVVSGISEEPCECNGGSCDSSGSGGSGVSGECPCKEQLEAIKSHTSDLLKVLKEQQQTLLEYQAHLMHIDERLTSYAEAMVSVFLNNGTIVVDEGTNSWTSVYTSGYSALYDYNKSNILQRIELLLYGLAFSSSSSVTNVDVDIPSMDDALDRINQASDDALSTLGEVSQGYQSDVDTMGSALHDLWSSLNFLGSGQLQNFALMEPTRVFDEYDLEFEFTHAADFSDLRTIVRTSFQVFYLLCSLAFIVVFWFKVVHFTYEKTLFVLDFFNKVLT